MREYWTLEKENMLPLRGAFFKLIGQEPACKLLYDILLTVTYTPPTKPLVLVFDGTAGNGKTTLAESLKEYANCDLFYMACNETMHLMDIFGGSGGISRSEEGSKLNNFLAANGGKLSIVILDELDKPEDPKLKTAFLTLFGSGRYHDRRNNRDVDCKKTIFIICSNAGSDLIKVFFNEHQSLLERHDPLFQTRYERFAKRELRQRQHTVFGPPLASRITWVIPFLPFTDSEALVGAATLFFGHRRDLGPRKKLVLNCENNEQRNPVHQVVANCYEGDAGFRSLESATFAELLSESKNPHLKRRDDALLQDKEIDDQKFEEILLTTVNVDGELEIIARKA